ncbi:hypothetical protein D7S86_24210 [Pararobbsia silviterrae]|uniref:Uncharacterized protein n=1 Tax=Pararobbsia silviterrae TaxID=1792498 RepID=A0A494XEN2_9BURK|nr:hypothetical protein D7S86_24210 [Pararobbsia silviterrae]
MIALALVLAGCALYSLIRGPLAPHRDAMPGIASMLVAIAPPVAFMLIAACRLSARWRALIVTGVVAAAASAVWIGHTDHSLRMIRFAYLVDHVVANLMLAHWFGRTLRPGIVPFCTQVARRVHRTVSDRVARYTRKVTLAWACVFALVAATSPLVYAAEAFETWLHFVWWSAAPLTIGVFIVEYAVRCIVIPAHERTTAVDMIRAIATMPMPGSSTRSRANAR